MPHVIMVTEPEDGYRDILQRVLTQGDRVSPRGLDTYELDNVTIVHYQPETLLLTGVGRGLSLKLAALEALQLVGGFSDPELLIAVAPHYASFLDGDSFHGSYGIRTHAKIEHVLNRLQTDINTRRALMTMWEDRIDLAEEGLHDYPCTMHVHFRIRNGVLDMTIVMRSNDVWLGYPYDIIQFSVLQSSMALYLGIPVGTYTHMVHSLHLYERNVEQVKSLLSASPTGKATSILHGGIAVPRGDDSLSTWTHVQVRASEICYDPKTVRAQNSLEAWLIEQSLKWQGHLA